MSTCKLCEYMRDGYQSKAAYFRSKNGIKTDNRPENLLIMKKEEHSKIHSIEQNKERLRDRNGRFV